MQYDLSLLLPRAGLDQSINQSHLNLNQLRTTRHLTPIAVLCTVADTPLVLNEHTPGCGTHTTHIHTTLLTTVVAAFRIAYSDHRDQRVVVVVFFLLFSVFQSATFRSRFRCRDPHATLSTLSSPRSEQVGLIEQTPAHVPDACPSCIPKQALWLHHKNQRHSC